MEPKPKARRAFSLSLAADDIVRIANRVECRGVAQRVRPRRTPRGRAAESEGATLFYALTAKARAAGTAYAASAREFSAHLKDLLFFDQNKRGRNYETVDLWINDDMRRSATLGRWYRWARHGRRGGEAGHRVPGTRGVPGGRRRRRRGAARDSLHRHGAKDRSTPPKSSRDSARNVCLRGHSSRKKRPRRDKLEALLLNVGDAMNETLYERTHSVVYASATLAVDEKFDAFEAALGLNAGELSTLPGVQAGFELRLRRAYDGVRSHRHARTERPCVLGAFAAAARGRAPRAARFDAYPVHEPPRDGTLLRRGAAGDQDR